MSPVRTWALLGALSGALSAALWLAAIPAPLLLGPMLAALGLAMHGNTLRLPRPVFTAAQGLVGCMIARSVTPDVLGTVARSWPALLFGAGYMIAASAGLGWLASRYGRLPGPVAAWGSSPGAASAMVSMADEFGADARLVATMQYVRVICVAITASVVSALLVGLGPGQADAAHPTPAPFDLGGFGMTLALAVGGAWLGRRSGLPAGGLLLPLAVGILVSSTGAAQLVLPSWLLAGAFAAIGWHIGLQFTPQALRTSVRALPEILLAAAAMILLCAGAAWLLVRWQGFSPLTAFLALSPGSIDSVAILAASGSADMGFVMALQALRLVAVVLLGPWVARWIIRTARP